MRRLIGKAALLGSVLGAGLTASHAAPPLTLDEVRGMAPEALREHLRTTEVLGYRIEADDCTEQSCDALSAQAAGFQDLINARLGGQDESDANAPRADLSADALRFSGRGPLFQRFRTAPQVIYLDLENDGSPIYPVDFFFVDEEAGETIFLGQNIFGDYFDFEYTAEDRAFVRDRIAEDYARFDIEIVTERPSSGEFATIDFTDNDRDPRDANISVFIFSGGGASFSILFGQAEGIDFGNDDYENGAFADANFWQIGTDLFGPGFFESRTGFPATPEGLRMATLNQAANTGAHEVGHAVGLRHHDSFGAPDKGLPSTGIPAPGTFIPTYEGPQGADETLLHIMASGASVGLPLAGSANQDRFFSERSALKLLLAEEALVFDEGELLTSPRADAKRLFLRPTFVPNTILEGENAGGDRILMRTAWVQGTLDGPGDTDEYSFRARGKTFINAELISFSDEFIANPVIATLNLYKVKSRNRRELVSTNLQTFEPFDPLLLDIEVPGPGEYVIEVVPQEVVFFPNGDGTFSPFPLIPTGNGALLQGDYDLVIYQVDRPLGSKRRDAGAKARRTLMELARDRDAR